VKCPLPSAVPFPIDFFVCSAISSDLSFTVAIDPCMNFRMLQRDKEALGRLCAPEELQLHCTRHLQ
jgi:hypothetical protein